MNNTSFRYLMIGLSLCIPVFYGEAQCPDSAALNITATLYTQEYGMTSNMTVGAARDSIGYMYFLGVNGKWNRYDGINFMETNGFIPTNHERFVLNAVPDNPYDRDSINQLVVQYGNKQKKSSATILHQYLYIIGTGNLLYEINLDNHEIKVIDIVNNWMSDHGAEMSMFAIYKDRLLIGTSNRGLLIYNRCLNSIQSFQYEIQNSAKNLTNSVVWIAVADDNVLWMQTDGGLIKLEINHQFIKTYLPSSVKEGGVCNNCNNIRGLFNRDDNHLLIASLEGAYSFELSTEKLSYLLSPTDHLPVWKNLPLSAIADDGNGNIFISSWDNEGILLLNQDEKKLLNIMAVADSTFAPFFYMRCLFYDSHHVLWVGTNTGFLRITNLDDFVHHQYKGKIKVSDRILETTSHQAYPIGSCFTFAEDSKGNVWMGSEIGLFIYRYATEDVTTYVHEEHNPSSINENDIRSIYISKDDDVWIGTNNGGLNHYNATSATFTSFTTGNGLPNNSIYTILEDHHGNLWLGTNGGICRFNKADHSVRNYTPRDGIQNYEFNTNAVAMIHDGRFCFGGRTGFNIFHPDSMNVTLEPSPVVISQFKIFDKEFPVNDKTMQLAHGENSFTFDFAALGFYRSSDHQYAYQMEGVDKDWIPSGNRTYTNYHNLAPGTYTFKVRAANYSGVWNEKAAFMKFIIYPAWYNTWWFRMALVLVLAAGIYELYRYRLRQLMKVQSIQNRIARDLHDEIGSTLSSISLSSTIIQNQLKGSHPEADKMLRQVSTNTDQMMEALSDIVWAINTRNDRFDNIVNRMRALAIEILEPSNISIQFTVGEDIRDIQLDMQQRKNLYLIFKEAINNIAKYSGCNKVVINIIRQAGKTIVMHIQDNGKGFDVSGLSGDEKSLSGNGIRNMKKRADELGGSLAIESAPGAGTKLDMKFSL